MYRISVREVAMRFGKLMALFVILSIVMAFAFVPVSRNIASAQTTYYVSPSGSDSNDGSAAHPWKTIQHAIDSVSTGDIIQVESGTYTEQLSVSKSLSIIGSSASGVTIDASGYISGYGIKVTADSVTLKKFTLKGPTGSSDGYGIHSAGGSNLDYENLVVENCGRSGIDFNGCTGITLNNITVKNNGGVGIALTDSHNATASNITTNNNTWGGMAVFTYGRYYAGGSSNITLTGTNGFNEPIPFYTETGHYPSGTDYPITNLNVSNDFHYIVRIPQTAVHKIVFYKTLNDAVHYGAALVTNNISDAVVNGLDTISTNGVINTLPASDHVKYYVGAGMLIQSAVNAAANGDTIKVLAGEFNEQVVVDKSLTILSDTEDYRTTNTVLTGDIPVFKLTKDANNTTIKGFKFKQVHGQGGAGDNTSPGVITNSAGSENGPDGLKVISNSFEDIHGPAVATDGPGITKNWLIEDNKITNVNWNNEKSALALFYLHDSVITRNIIDTTEYAGMILDNLKNVVISYNVIKNTPRKAIQVAHSPDSNVTIRDNIIDNTNTSHHFDEGGISIYPDTTNIRIQGNEIFNCYRGFTVRHKTGSASNDVLVNYNNIYNNEDLAAANFAQNGGSFNAQYNWWGEHDKSGPKNSTSNPSGTGGEVGDGLVFDPWVGKTGDKTEGPADGVTGGTVYGNMSDTFQNARMGVGADVLTNDTAATSDVMLVKYIDNPTAVPFTASFSGSFYDLNVTNPSNFYSVTLKLYYPSTHGPLTPFWFDKTANEWKVCSNYTDHPGSITLGLPGYTYTYAGYVSVELTSSSIPSVSDLTGTYFALGTIQYTLTVNISGQGSVSKNPDQITYDYGTTVTLTPTADTGWSFTGWSGDVPSGHEHDNPLTITMDSNKTITATFAENTYTVTASSNGGGTVSPATQNVTYGDSASITITPNTGYHIQSVTDNGTDVTGSITDNGNGTYTYTISNVTANHTVNVTFVINTYTIIASASDGGTISPSGTVTVNYGDRKTFTIKANTGYMINNIFVDGIIFTDYSNKIETQYTFSKVKSDHTIRATFIKISKSNGNSIELTYKITAEVSVYGGSATVTPKKQIVKSGEKAVITITPDSGYHISYVTDNGTFVPTYKLKKVSENSYRYEINAVYESHKIIIYLERNMYRIVIKTGEGGSVSPSGIVSVRYNDSVEFTVTPKSGYKISKVIVDGKEVKLSDNKFTIPNIKGNHDVKVTFEKIVTKSQASTMIALQINNPFITVNGSKHKIDAQNSKPIIRNNRTLLPIRTLIEALGGTISWNPKTREVTINLNGHTIILTIGKSAALVDGIKTPIDPKNSKVVPIIINGRTYLPLRFIAEHLGCTVDWDGATRTITIYYWP